MSAVRLEAEPGAFDEAVDRAATLLSSLDYVVGPTRPSAAWFLNTLREELERQRRARQRAPHTYCVACLPFALGESDGRCLRCGCDVNYVRPAKSELRLPNPDGSTRVEFPPDWFWTRCVPYDTREQHTTYAVVDPKTDAAIVKLLREAAS